VVIGGSVSVVGAVVWLGGSGGSVRVEMSVLLGSISPEGFVPGLPTTIGGAAVGGGGVP
jgi:hypothetical protein